MFILYLEASYRFIVALEKREILLRQLDTLYSCTTAYVPWDVFSQQIKSHLWTSGFLYASQMLYARWISTCCASYKCFGPVQRWCLSNGLPILMCMATVHSMKKPTFHCFMSSLCHSVWWFTLHVYMHHARHILCPNKCSMLMSWPDCSVYRQRDRKLWLDHLSFSCLAFTIHPSGPGIQLQFPFQNCCPIPVACWHGFDLFKASRPASTWCDISLDFMVWPFY